jgi:hypothetical protein
MNPRSERRHSCRLRAFERRYAANTRETLVWWARKAGCKLANVQSRSQTGAPTDRFKGSRRESGFRRILTLKMRNALPRFRRAFAKGFISEDYSASWPVPVSGAVPDSSTGTFVVTGSWSGAFGSSGVISGVADGVVEGAGVETGADSLLNSLSRAEGPRSWKCVIKIEIPSERTKNIVATYLVSLVSALPAPAPNSASDAPPPKASPAPASFLGN